MVSALVHICTVIQKEGLTSGSVLLILLFLLFFLLLTHFLRRAATLLCRNRRALICHLNELTGSRIKLLGAPVFIRIHRQAAFFQQAANDLCHRAVQHRKQRHAHRHADKTEYTAEQQDRKHNPEARQAGRVAQNFGAEDIAVKLLQGENEQHKINRLNRADYHDQDGARNRTDERPEKRDDIGYTDDNRNQQRKRLIHRHQAEADKQA